MKILASVLCLALAVLALVAFHLAAAFFVLLCVAAAVPAALYRWCVDRWRRSVGRQRRTVTLAS